MTTLRSLLYNQGAKNQCSESYCTSSLNPTACMFVLYPHCSNVNDGNYNNNCMLGWCVPQDTKCCVTFEIIGGGGGGPGGCCCVQGNPGGSGAYAVKTLLIPQGTCQNAAGVCCTAPSGGNLQTSTTQPLNNYSWCVYTSGQQCRCDLGFNYTYPGECYCLVAAGATDCSISCIGCVGCTSYVNGQGLCNFCADGGVPGRNCCFFYWGSWSTYASQCAAYGHIIVGGVDEFGGSCSCYYGADCGAPGKPGYAWSMCGCGTSCYWKQAIPFPGGLINQGGGHVMLRTQGDACFSDWIRCISSIGFPIHADTGGTGFIPGQGGNSTTVCGGGCCYGYPGGPGMVRITYR